MSLITYKVFQNSIDAHIFKLKLESEGIPCYLFDEHIVSVNPLYSNLVGGIKLKINETDLIHAKNVEYELRQTALETENNEPITCPNCHSVDIESGYFSMKSIGAIISA
jgi:hypothetical protein